MYARFSIAVIALLSLWLSGGLAHGDDQQPEAVQQDVSAVGSRALAITEVVLQNHIDPPTRQQMVLAGVKALYRASSQPVPNGLSERISQLAKSDELLDFLNEVAAQFNNLPDLATILTNGMFEAIPGGGSLITGEIDRIQQSIAANRYVGIGIVLSLNEEKIPQVPQVLFGGPAWNAGMKHGDLLIEINSQPTTGKDLETVIQELRGEDGSEITLVVRQPDSEESRTLTMKRGRVFIPTVEGFRKVSDGEWDYMVDAENGIALLRISTIGPSTLHELRQVETKLQSQNVRGIILDLRMGGGIMHDVVMVADALLDDGVIGQVRTLQRVEKYEALPGSLFPSIPMVVLITSYSAGDRLFLTAALQDHGRAVVVGMPSAGQAYVNSILPIPGHSERIRVAIGVMQRGDGTPLIGPQQNPRIDELSQPLEAPKQRPGFIMPDHVVNPGQVQQPGNDAILARAVEVMKAAAAQPDSRPHDESDSEQ